MPLATGPTMIRTGTYFGECFIHCNETVVITDKKISYELTSKFQDPQHPDIFVERQTSSDEWRALVALVDRVVFDALPATIGQPDGADQGGEWVEITYGRAVKRVDFEVNATLPTIDDLLHRLRIIRTDMRRGTDSCNIKQ